MNQNYRLREMLSRVKGIGCDHTLRYAAILNIRFNPEEEVKRLMAEKVAHDIAGQIYGKGEWRHERAPEGEVFSVRGYWLTYDALYDLLEQAYSLGRTEPVAMIGRAE